MQGACLDENTLAALAHGGLGAAALQQADAHLDVCAECRFLLAELAQPAGRAPVDAVLGRGDKVGRYVILEHVGSGGMGVVYAAYDPQLDRRVALKRLQKRWLDPEQAARMQDRLRREAQAMARLSHPGVLPVHDIGLAGEQLYLVTEFVAGGSLRQWLRAAPRRWDEIVAAFVAAGRGLLAAHRAGLLHCDFKPDNVLRDHDGRILVGDFGLARIAAADDDPDAGDAARPGAGDRERSDSQAAGTPAYMAPEQFRRETVTAQTDQFSFCVALYEALYGVSPHAGDTLAERRDAVLSGPLPRPPAGAVPAAVRRAVLRGLARDPAARFPSMDALLRQLTRARPRRRAVGIAIGLGLVAALAWGLGRLPDRRLEACRQAAAPIGPVWAAAQAALQPRGGPAQPLTALLEAYQRGWAQARAEACAATRIRREQSEATLALQAACLDERLAAVQALAGLLRESPPLPLAPLLTAAAALDDLHRCGALQVLSARGQPPPPALADRVAALRAQIAQTTVLRNAGLHARCTRPADAILQAARSLAYRPLLAEALLLQGSVELAADTAARGEPTLKEALWLAQATRHDEVAARAWLKLVESVRTQPARSAEAEAWGRHAGAAIERLGGDAQLAGTLAALRGGAPAL